MGASVHVAPVMIAPSQLFLLLLCKSRDDTHILNGRPTMPIARRDAEVQWEGSLARGAGTLTSGSSALDELEGARAQVSRSA